MRRSDYLKTEKFKRKNLRKYSADKIEIMEVMLECPSL